MNIYEVLNEKQAKAATYLDHHLRIIAGAGSGKTRVLTYRIAYLIEEMGISPMKILAITFTNKAANEMKERVASILGTMAYGTTICTIHSFCVRILRRHIGALGYPTNFIIMDEDDQKALLKKLYKDHEISEKVLRYKSVLNSISAYKHHHLTFEELEESAKGYPGEMMKAKLYRDYVNYQKTHHMLDFDDLLLKTLELFHQYPDILDIWQSYFQYIHVDEFQDVDKGEYELVRLLSKKAIVCVVGDPDQTIYSFRGASVDYILDFEKDFENAKTIILNENYRSTKTILNSANCLIKKNKKRVEKDLYTSKEEGNKIIHYSGKDEEDEASFVVDKIEEICSKVEGVNYHDFAILYRANYLSRTIEQELIRRGVDYRLFGGLRFFNRKEIKDALSYLRLAGSEDDLSFERIINVPSRGIGQKTIERIGSVASSNGCSMYEALCLYADEIKLSAKMKKEARVMVEAIEKARLSKLSLADTFEQLMIDTGYIEMLKADQEEGRIDNLMELKNSMNRYSLEHEDASIEGYLQEIALYTSQDVTSEDEYVSLMSIHMAKGLEFNYVFVMGLSEDVFPSMKSLAETYDDGLEEERRLAYVAFTRAKKQLFLTDSQGFSFISNSPKITSRFVSEIGEEGIEHIGQKPRFKTRDYVSLNPTKEELIGDNHIEDFKSGDYIQHDIFGKGVILKVNGDLIDVAFALPHGIKTLMKNHKAIKKVGGDLLN